MKYAVIDIGSNTIRMVTCTTNGKRAEISGNERAASIILRCIKNSRLTLEGINFLIDTVNSMKEKSGNPDVIYAFATASLRNAENADEVCRIVEESTGVAIRLISGDEEAQYDFYSLRFLNKTDESGMGFDLGGGSCQLFTFGNNELVYSVSLPIGSYKTYTQYVKGDIPTPEEAQLIYDTMSQELKSHPLLGNHKFVYAIGGSARCATLLYNEVFGSNLSAEIGTEELRSLYKRLVEDSETALKILSKSFPDRLNSLIPGIITICAICDTVGAEKIRAAVCGVREGFIFKEILQKGNI